MSPLQPGVPRTVGQLSHAMLATEPTMQMPSLCSLFKAVEVVQVARQQLPEGQLAIERQQAVCGWRGAAPPGGLH